MPRTAAPPSLGLPLPDGPARGGGRLRVSLFLQFCFIIYSTQGNSAAARIRISRPASAVESRPLPPAPSGWFLVWWLPQLRLGSASSSWTYSPAPLGEFQINGSTNNKTVIVAPTTNATFPAIALFRPYSIWVCLFVGVWCVGA